jgi:hypothetical protein
MDQDWEFLVLTEFVVSKSAGRFSTKSSVSKGENGKKVTILSVQVHQKAHFGAPI